MRRPVTYLILLALSAYALFNFTGTPNTRENTKSNISSAEDDSLPLNWPPRAEDGRRESFLNALNLYFQALFSADEIVEEAQNVADKAAQRQHEIDQALKDNQ